MIGAAFLDHLYNRAVVDALFVDVAFSKLIKYYCKNMRKSTK